MTAQEPKHGPAGPSQRRARRTTREQAGLIPDEDFWGRPDKELTQLAEAAERYVYAKGGDRHPAEAALRGAVRALRRARHAKRVRG